MRPGLLVLLPLAVASPVVAVVLGSGPAGASASAGARVAPVAATSDAEPGLGWDATVPRPAVPIATPTPTTVASAPVRAKVVAPPASRTRAVVLRRSAARRPVAAAPAPRATSAPASAAPVAVAPAPQPAPARTGRDDYPYRTATTNSYDDWGFTKRQCVSFAAWRLAQAGRALDNRADGWGSAANWDDTARRLGKAVTTRPAVGTVAHWQAGESSAYYAPGSTTANGRYAAGSYGHVGWVTHVFADGSVQVEAYNGSGDRSWSTMRVRAPRFLRL